jgi:hypothetical protein
MSTSAAAPFRGGFEEGVQSTAPYFQAVSERFVSRNGLFEAQHGPRLGTAPTASIVDPYQSLQRRVQGIVVRDLAIGERAITTKGLNPSNQDRHARLRGEFEYRAGPYYDASFGHEDYRDALSSWIGKQVSSVQPQLQSWYTSLETSNLNMLYYVANDFAFLQLWGGSQVADKILPLMQACFPLAIATTVDNPITESSTLLVPYFVALVDAAQNAHSQAYCGTGWSEPTTTMFTSLDVQGAWSTLTSTSATAAQKNALQQLCWSWYSSWYTTVAGSNPSAYGPNGKQLFNPYVTRCNLGGGDKITLPASWNAMLTSMEAGIKAAFNATGCPNGGYPCPAAPGGCATSKSACAALSCPSGQQMCNGQCISNSQSCSSLSPVEIALIVAIPLLVVGAIGAFSYARGASVPMS